MFKKGKQKTKNPVKMGLGGKSVLLESLQCLEI